MSINMDRIYDFVQFRTEAWLTGRKAKKEYERTHRSLKTEILGWLDAIAFAVVVVLLINLFFVQLFVIPSPSMESTLMTGDRVVVSKYIYGCEIFPEGPKIFSGRIPDRDDIITFYNPEYESKGAFFSTFSTILYMATFSLVNIDRDENGNIREKLLVKRVGGSGGDTVTFENGNAKIKLSGTDTYVDEAVFRSSNGYSTGPVRKIEESTYDSYIALAQLNGMAEKNLSYNLLPSHLLTSYQSLDKSAFYTDNYAYYLNVAEGSRKADPTDMDARSTHVQMKSGLYVPPGYVLPLGDNRDNSNDGRYFGPVPESKINGRVVSVFWPLSSIKSVLDK
ncbi:MAG: signal peptidase I [Sphaerochaetaceae bacterium]|nr:signal peptidase I [Sphaerochaetaceae bacterium]